MDTADLQSEFKNHLNQNGIDDFGLIVNSVGLKIIKANCKTASAKHSRDYKISFTRGKISDEFKIIYITNGEGFLRFHDNEEVKLTQGNALIIRPNQAYEYFHNNKTEWKEYFIRFEANDTFFQSINELFNGNNQLIEIGFNEDLIRLFNRAIDIVRDQLKSSQIYLSGMLLHILGLIIFESNNSALNKRNQYLIDKAKIIMNEKVLEDIQLSEIASELNISYSSFRINFKKYAGVSPAKYLRDTRLNKSKQMLHETTLSIKEIAFQLQFSSLEYFSTIFKKQFGISPKEFKTL